MMSAFSDFVISLISKDFELNVVKLSNGQLLLVKDLIQSVLEIFYTDVMSKYPIFNQINNERELIKVVQGDCTLLACLLYRIERELFLKGKDPDILALLANLMRTRTGIELYYSTKIGKGLNIQHGTGIVVGPRYIIGDNFLIHQGVTLGQRRGPNDIINIQNNVSIFAGAKILGNIFIGDNVKIAANAVLLIDAIENSTYAGIPASKIR